MMVRQVSKRTGSFAESVNSPRQRSETKEFERQNFTVNLTDHSDSKKSLDKLRLIRNVSNLSYEETDHPKSPIEIMPDRLYDMRFPSIQENSVEVSSDSMNDTTELLKPPDDDDAAI